MRCNDSSFGLLHWYLVNKLLCILNFQAGAIYAIIYIQDHVSAMHAILLHYMSYLCLCGALIHLVLAKWGTYMLTYMHTYALCGALIHIMLAMWDTPTPRSSCIEHYYAFSFLCGTLTCLVLAEWSTDMSHSGYVEHSHSFFDLC